jgi:hypothetical protein
MPFPVSISVLSLFIIFDKTALWGRDGLIHRLSALKQPPYGQTILPAWLVACGNKKRLHLIRNEFTGKRPASLRYMIRLSKASIIIF